MGALFTSSIPGSLDLADHQRRGWSRFFHWVASSRAHRVLCLIVGIWLLNGFDLSLTILANQHGLLHEQNPFARRFLEHGAFSIMLFKVALVAIGSYPLLRFRRTRIAELGALVVLGAYAMLAVRWSTCVDLYTLSLSNPITLADVESLQQAIPH